MALYGQVKFMVNGKTGNKGNIDRNTAGVAEYPTATMFGPCLSG